MVDLVNEPSFDRPVRPPDFVIIGNTNDYDRDSRVLRVWIDNVVDEDNAFLTYAYDNEYFKADKAARAIVKGDYIKYKFNDRHNWSPWGPTQVKEIKNNIRLYINRVIEESIWSW